MTTSSPSAPDRGFIAIAMVVVLSAVGLSTALGAISSAVALSDIEVTAVQGLRATWLADACVEHARASLRTSGYDGNETLQLLGGDCEVLSIGTMATASYEVRAQGNAGDAVARVVASFQIGGTSTSLSIEETAWERVADF